MLGRGINMPNKEVFPEKPEAASGYKYTVTDNTDSPPLGSATVAAGGDAQSYTFRQLHRWSKMYETVAFSFLGATITAAWLGNFGVALAMLACCGAAFAFAARAYRKENPRFVIYRSGGVL